MDLSLPLELSRPGLLCLCLDQDDHWIISTSIENAARASLLYCSTRVSGFAVSGARVLRCLLCGCISIKFHINEWKVTVNQNESKLFKFILDSLKHKGRNDNYIFYDLITAYNRRK